jgi:(R)-2-hydroxyacyl-CoA dehydratese activating ATPase
MLACGIDVGTALTKCVIMDGNDIVQGRGLVDSGANLPRSSRHALKEALKEADCEEYDLSVIIGTGFGRFAIPFGHKNATETSCHAIGAIWRYPGTRTIINMGGQDLTAIRIDKSGMVLDFAMNDKCSAGSGRFLEVLPDIVGVPFDRLRDIELEKTDHIRIKNACSVFAEQEIINHFENGEAVEDILDGVFQSLARRCASLLNRVGLEEEITFTGGVSCIKGVVKALSELVGSDINAGVDGVYVGAVGAALTGLRSYNSD